MKTTTKIKAPVSPVHLRNNCTGERIKDAELIDKILSLLKKASHEDLKLFLIFIEGYLRKKKCAPSCRTKSHVSNPQANHVAGGKFINISEFGGK